MIKRLVYLLFTVGSCSLFSNPFLIEWQAKEDLSSSDWIQVQEKLRKIDLTSTVKEIYPTSGFKKKNWFSKEELKDISDFLGRTSRGVQQTLIDVPHGIFPSKTLIKINQGGSDCIVSFASYNGVYTKQLQENIKCLEETGWDGYFLLFQGGYPNPTGEEIRYAGVPYAFKIFALLEAKKQGFHKALWIDAALQPLQNLHPLFEEIETKGSLFQLRKNGTRYLLPKTRQVLLEETGIDMYEAKSVRARIIGLDFRKTHVQELIQEYYRLVKLGTPFLSCFPEEFVLGALVAKHPEKFSATSLVNLVKNERKLHGKSAKSAQKEHYFFLLRQH